MTTAVVANGQYAEAAAWGVEMAELVQEVTNLPTMFLVDSYGTFGQVTWLSGAPDLATADAAGEAINTNPDYLKRLSDVGDLFVPRLGGPPVRHPHRLKARRPLRAGAAGVEAAARPPSEPDRRP